MRIVKRILATLLALVLALVGFVYFSLRADIPDDGLVLSAPAAASQAPVLIFGATRNTGLEFARLLEARGERIIAFVRPSSDRSQLEGLNAEFLVGDAMDMDSVVAAVSSEPFRAVVSTVGCFSCEPPVDFVANRNIADAAEAAGVPRMLLVTTIGSGDSYDSVPLLSRFFLGGVLPLKTQAEDHLKSANMEHIIIRPGGLGTDPATGTGMLSENPETFGFINRTDLAQLMVACLDGDACVGKTLAAVDKNKSTPW